MRDTLCKIFRGKAIWTARLQWALFLAALAWFPGGPARALANPLPAGSSAVSSKKLPPKIDAIQNFHWVDHRLCRGGQVQKSQFKLLKEAGVTTVLNLREDFKEWEQAEAEKAGLKYLNIPMSSTRYPSDEEVRKIVEYIGTPESTDVVYVHCAGGKHRTGGAVAVYRILYYGWDFDKVYREMEECWFYTAGGHECYKDFVQKFAADQAQGRNADLMALGRRSFSAREGGANPAAVPSAVAEVPVAAAPEVAAGETTAQPDPAQPPATGAPDEPPAVAVDPAVPVDEVALTTQPRLVERVSPRLPDTAKTAKVYGKVVLSVVITPSGKVSDIKVTKGPKILRGAAVEAVKQWRYTPGTVRGVKVPVNKTIEINFDR
ncbi:MAG: TonB family protein [Acidobacteria bacterium]|nr:TonB family protein [Acidobacteriota bacterium]